MKEKPWHELAQRLREERDPDKMLKLCRELDEAMLQEERRRVRLKLEQQRGNPLGRSRGGSG